MLRWRLLGTLLVVTPLFGILWLEDRQVGGAPGIWFGALMYLLALACCYEFSHLFRNVLGPASHQAVAFRLWGVASVATLLPVAARAVGIVEGGGTGEWIFRLVPARPELRCRPIGGP